MAGERRHRFWHWWFTVNVSLPYRFVERWYGTQVQYQKEYCHICKRVVKVNYEQLFHSKGDGDGSI